MEYIKNFLKKLQYAAATTSGAATAYFPEELLKNAYAPNNDAVLKGLDSQLSGLTEDEAEIRLVRYGLNEIAREKRKSILILILSNVKNPLIILLTALGIISIVTGDVRAATVIFFMVLLGVMLRFVQEFRADQTAAKLKAMVSNTATVVRDGKEMEIALRKVVPGDIVKLAAGDMIPADVRLLSTKDLFLNQAVLTGESLPVEKTHTLPVSDIKNPLDLPNICFQGSNVISGSAIAVVIHTGGKTYFGSLAAHIVGQRVLTSFDKGVNKFAATPGLSGTRTTVILA